MAEFGDPAVRHGFRHLEWDFDKSELVECTLTCICGDPIGPFAPTLRAAVDLFAAHVADLVHCEDSAHAKTSVGWPGVEHGAGKSPHS